MPESVEHLRVIHIGEGAHILSVADYAGASSWVEIPVRTIVADALALNTAALILSHNHPSGDPTPSDADITATRYLRILTRGLGIRLHDHLIYGAGHCVSLRTLGLL